VKNRGGGETRRGGGRREPRGLIFSNLSVPKREEKKKGSNLGSLGLITKKGEEKESQKDGEGKKNKF